ncbi:hypothetical protein ABZ128_27670 [Streptomyces sp. NPDC006326]|uniref:hypothetical protein n=1 Tax=Streptomyces sp. NPDC006326 TaxID=3156752 RepID=UPI0033B73E47
MRKPRRTAAIPAVVLCALLALGACSRGGGGTGGTPGGDNGPGASGGGASVDQKQISDVPAALIGSWSGGSSDGFKSSVYSFYPDGSYRMDIGNASITGRFTVDGNQLTTYTEGGSAQMYRWGIGAQGYLFLNGQSYVPFS